MRNLFMKVVVVAMVVAIASCKQTAKTDSSLSPDLLGEAASTLNYSTFVDSIRYIELESGEDCLIGRIDDVILTDGKCFISDKMKQCIWIYSDRGEYLACIDRKGTGPEEYVRIIQFEFDAKQRQIAVLNSGTEILYYDLEGNFIRKICPDQSITDFKLLPEGGFIVSNIGYPKKEAGVFRADANGKFIETLVTRNPEFLISCNGDRDLQAYNHTITFISANFENTIYHYQDGRLTVAYPFVFLPLPEDKYTTDVSAQYLKDFYRTTYLEGEKWILSTFWCNTEDLRVFVYSKEGKRYWIGKEWHNDIDGIECDGKTTMSDQNRFVFWCENKKNPDGNPMIQMLYLK